MPLKCVHAGKAKYRAHSLPWQRACGGAVNCGGPSGTQ